jgi:hypothetical protein
MKEISKWGKSANEENQQCGKLAIGGILRAADFAVC